MNKTLSLKGKVALITGGTRGLGKAMVDVFTRHGARVIFTGTSSSKSTAHGSKAFWPLDLSSQTSIQEFRRRLQALPRLDILINNAGINAISPIDQIREDDWQNIIQVNLTGAMVLMKEAAGLMKKNKSGHILNVSSIFGIISKARRNAYSASKAGLIGLTRASSLDLAPHGILVNAICPGFVNTDLTKRILSAKERAGLAAQVPMGRFGSEEEIALAAAFLCSNWNTYITGQTFVVDGGFSIQ